MAGSLTDVDERKHAEAAVRQSREQLRQLAARLADVREQERTRLSREVHDVLGQTLTVLQMNVAMIEKGLTEEQQALHDRIAVMKQAINETVRTVRRIAHELRPGILDDLGVLAAIEWETQRFASRTDIACTFVDDVEDLDLDPKRSTTVFRVFQEIMTNVARHAEATEVVVTATQRNGCLTLIVQDNGRGIREEELKNTTSLGLLGMRERLFPWGGHVDFAGAPNEGTTVTVTLPLSHLQPAM
jgi:signal transduction histidine kinase